MTDEQITDRMAQMIRVGFVNARHPEKMRVKVTVPDTTGAELVTDFLPVLCPRACEDMQYDLPDVGDQVLCLFLPYGLEQGFVIGAMYGKQAPPVQSGDKWHRKFKDGTYLEYDRESHKLVANVRGDVEITATGNVDAKVEGNMSAKAQGPASVESKARLSLDAPSMNMGGGSGGATSASMQGTFRLTRGDIIAEAVSLRNHVHVCPACGAQTSPPVGGGSGGAGGSGASGGSGGGGESGGAGTESGNESSGAGNDSNQGNDSGPGNGSDGAEGNGGNGGDPALELPPALAGAIAATGFAWTEQGKAQFEETKKQVQLQDNETFDTILCLPAIAEAEARNMNNENRLGWLYLKQMFEKWLSGKANPDPFKNGEPFWVSMDWALKYKRVQWAWNDLVDPGKLFNEKAQELLAKRLADDHKFTQEKMTFEFTKAPWPHWNSLYFQRQDVQGMAAIPPDGLTAAMGDFSLRALADGYVIPAGCKYLITVTKIAIFIWDSFNFDGNSWLGNWRCQPPAFSYLSLEDGVSLFDSDFRNFEESVKSGDEFLVLAMPKNVDSFTGYAYEIQK